jgi:hypothetical protein
MISKGFPNLSIPPRLQSAATKNEGFCELFLRKYGDRIASTEPLVAYEHLCVV